MMDTVAVAVRVNQGRWIADCPFCPGAEKIWPGGRLQYRPDVPHPFGIVDSTLHCGYSGEKAPVVFPADAPLIHQLLEKRPDPHNRNWTPGETVEDLIFENLSHGVA